eukprot:Clim_evm13s183 gene=Clim_evmTU13s183
MSRTGRAARASEDPTDHKYILYGGQFSPFLHKLRPALSRAGLPYKKAPNIDGNITYGELDSAHKRVQAMKKKNKPDVPENWIPDMDEFPLAPYLLRDDGMDLVDSTAIIHWADKTFDSSMVPRVPDAGRSRHYSEALRWVAMCLEELPDEWGQCLALHQRWVYSGDTVFAGEGIVEEIAAGFGLPTYAISPHNPTIQDSRQLPGWRGWFASAVSIVLLPVMWLLVYLFDRRQITRLPYHNSFAPKGFKPLKAGRPAPPSWEDEGFPPTHKMLEDGYLGFCQGVEDALTSDGRPFIMGQRFTIVDASCFGVLYMKHFSDVRTRKDMVERYPKLCQWIDRVETLTEKRDRFDAGWGPDDGQLNMDGLQSLMRENTECQFPLIFTQVKEYEKYRAQGQTLFNEAALNKREALYYGEIRGHRYRHVVKTFQVKVAYRLRDQWEELSDGARTLIKDKFGDPWRCVDPAVQPRV